jgi:hypothetical protein
MLYEFIAANREEIVARTREKAASRPGPRAILDELKDGVPSFLGQIVETLRLSGDDSAAMGESARKNGGDELKRGFTVGQVVHGYGDVCQAVTELAEEKRRPSRLRNFIPSTGAWMRSSPGPSPSTRASMS